MTKSMLSTAALSAVIAGGLLAGTAQAQSPYTPPSGGMTAAPDVAVGTPVGGPGVLIAPPANAVAAAPIANNGGMGIGSGMNGGAGPPLGGLDSNPYAEAPQAARALGYPYHPPAKSGTGTMN